jgi:hypothetical protein
MIFHRILNSRFISNAIISNNYYLDETFVRAGTFIRSKAKMYSKSEPTDSSLAIEYIINAATVKNNYRARVSSSNKLFGSLC